MSDETALAEPLAAPESGAPQTPPEPKSVFDTVSSVFEDMEAAPEPVEGGEAPTPGDSYARDPATGRFVAQNGEAQPLASEPGKAQEAAQPPVATEAPLNFNEAPARFSADAKSAWANAPEPIRAEVHRMQREMEAGIEKHRAGAEAYEPLRQYSELCERNGTTLPDVVGHYVALEGALRQNVYEGLDAVCNDLKIEGGLSTVAFSIAEAAGWTPPDGQQPPADGDDATPGAYDPLRDPRVTGIIGELKNEIASLRQDMGGVSNSIQSHNMSVVGAEVQAFASQPEYARFGELVDDIKFFLDTRLKSDVEQARRTGDMGPVLKKAYEMADRLNPAPSQAAPAANAAPTASQSAAQTRIDKGRLSTTGAPDPGSNPATQRVPATALEAVTNAVNGLF